MIIYLVSENTRQIIFPPNVLLQCQGYRMSSANMKQKSSASASCKWNRKQEHFLTRHSIGLPPRALPGICLLSLNDTIRVNFSFELVCNRLSFFSYEKHPVPSKDCVHFLKDIVCDGSEIPRTPRDFRIGREDGLLKLRLCFCFVLFFMFIHSVNSLSWLTSWNNQRRSLTKYQVTQEIKAGQGGKGCLLVWLSFLRLWRWSTGGYFNKN